MDSAIEHLKNCDAQCWHLPPEAFHPSEERFWVWNDEYFRAHQDFVILDDVSAFLTYADDKGVSTPILRVFLSHWWTHREHKSTPFSKDTKDMISQFLKKTRPIY